MAPLLAIPTVIIASFCCVLLRAQGVERKSSSADTVGIYFSSRGFRFDSPYQKAILTATSEPLTGKAAFLLGLADSLGAYLTEAGFPTLNLHRYPMYAPYIEGREPLPPHWKGLLHIQSLQLQAIPQKAVYAQSNRLHSERYHRLEFTLTALYHANHRIQTLSYHHQLPAEGWRQALLETLRREFLLLLAGE